MSGRTDLFLSRLFLFFNLLTCTKLESVRNQNKQSDIVADVFDLENEYEHPDTQQEDPYFINLDNILLSWGWVHLNFEGF